MTHLLNRKTNAFTRPQPKAFTLVELLVVIGIIAVLIAIIFPSLAKAREQAKAVVCASGMRQLGNAFYIYAQQNRGSLPYGYWSGGTDTTRAGDWTTLIANAMSNRYGTTYQTSTGYNLDNYRSGPRGMFICASAIEPTADGLLTHFAGHPRLMPNIGNVDRWLEVSSAGTKIKNYVPYAIARIKRPAEIALAWDGALKSDSGGTQGQYGTNVTSGGVDNGRFTRDNYLVRYDLFSASYMRDQASIDLNISGQATGSRFINTDGPTNWGNPRFRHGRNNRIQILHVDGHVGNYGMRTPTNTDFVRGMIYVNSNW